MKKYRILENNNKFYPQYLGWFNIWQYFTEMQTDDVDGCDGLHYYSYKVIVSFETLEEAKKFINDNKIKIHYLD